MSEAHTDERVVVYVWDPVVRITHWLIVGGIVVLSATGYFIGSPFPLSAKPANQTFVMGWVRLVHSYTAIIFSTSVFARILWMFLGPPVARWNQFVPSTRQRLKDLWGTLLFYTFIRRDPPPCVGHNALAGASYIAVFGMYIGMVLTGLVLYIPGSPVGSYLHLFDFLVPLFGGMQSARSGASTPTSAAKLERNGTLDSIFTGFKYLPPKGPHA